MSACDHGFMTTGDPPTGAIADGPWISCPWCSGAVPLTHFAESDEEPGAHEAVCDGCGRRVTFLPPVGPEDETPSAMA
jgi:hypothetical protein